LLFKHKNVVKVYMQDLESEREKLAIYLQSKFKLTSKLTREGLELNMDDAPNYSALTMVTKFIHDKNLSNKYWVSSENNKVKINKFKHDKKEKENKHPTTPSIIKHGF
jgi:hypothetical protein